MEFLNVKTKQNRFLKRIFSSTKTTNGSSGHWKILVYDQYGKRLISPVLSVQELRKLGITLHLPIKSKREPVPEVPIVYLIKPTQENIMLLKSDCEKNLYDEIHVHFTEPAAPALLEFFAKCMVEVGSVSKIKRVFDQFVGFVSLETDLFTLDLKNSFKSYNQPSLQESTIMSFMNSVATGLINTLTTLKVLPIIRCPKNGPSQLLAKLLTERLYQLHQETEYQEAFLLKEDSSADVCIEEIALSSRRPILLLTDRGVDISTMLFHSSGYQTLVDDLLKIDSNRVTIPASDEEKEKHFSLSSDNDDFWKEFGGRMIPEAVENHSTELQRVSSQVNKIKEQTGLSEGDMNGSASNSLLKTVESLPQLLEKKKLLEMHLDIIKKTMSEVSLREIYNFAEVEEKMISRNYGDLNEVTKLLNNDQLKFVDKARLVATFLLNGHANKTANDSAVQLLETIKDKLETASLEETNAYNVVSYIRKLQALTSGLQPKASLQRQGSAGLWKFADKAAQSFVEAHKKVKGMVNSSSLFPVVQLLDIATRAVQDDDSTKVDDELAYYDPKIGIEETVKHQRQQGQINSGIVFVLGGGCYAEYQNLRSYCSEGTSSVLQSMTGNSKKQMKRFVYGCTEMLNAKEFMEQVSECL